MNCPNCGAELPEGSTWCAACGNAVDSQPAGGASDSLFSGAPAEAPAKKSKAGVIIAVVAVIAVIAVLAVVVLTRGGKYNGSYKLTSVSTYGMEFTVDQFEAMAGVELDMTLTVKGSKCELKVSQATADAMGSGFTSGTGKIKFDGTTVTIESDGTLTGTYDPDAKTITLTESGVDMVFTKQ